MIPRALPAPAAPLVAPLLAILLAGPGAGCAGHGQAGAARRVQVALARELAAQGDAEAAFQAVDGPCREPPRDGAACAVRGSLLLRRGLLDQAEADLQDAVRLAPGLPDAHAGLAVVHERRRRPELAEAEHRRAVELAPHDARFLNNLGFALLSHGKAREAVPVLERAAREDPLERRVRNNLGFALARTNEFGRAAREFELGGTPAEARNNLGYAYEGAGNLAQARAQYQEALRLDPALTAARENLARLRGEPAEAPTAARSPPGPEAREPLSTAGGPP